nr:hypothetical protein [Geminisphaera colitermitum]
MRNLRTRFVNSPRRSSIRTDTAGSTDPGCNFSPTSDGKTASSRTNPVSTNSESDPNVATEPLANKSTTLDSGPVTSTAPRGISASLTTTTAASPASPSAALYIAAPETATTRHIRTDSPAPACGANILQHKRSITDNVAGMVGLHPSRTVMREASVHLPDNCQPMIARNRGREKT